MILYLELKLRPISIIKIKSNYWMKLLEIAFILFRIQMEMQNNN
jgi:hypothetical protein